MSLTELTDYLEAMASRLDYVKISPPQALACPHDWVARKVETYVRHGVVPYFDHGYFNMARRLGVKVEDAILAARELGMRVIEFWNAGAPVTADRWGELVRFAASNDMKVIFEYHPAHLFDPVTGLRLPGSPPQDRVIDAEEILRTAMPCLEAGAMVLMVDHKTFDALGDRAGEVLEKLVERLELPRIVFEADSEKHQEHLAAYFKLIGPDANVANLLPGQAPSVDIMRWKLF